jgi:hypothetical protein
MKIKHLKISFLIFCILFLTGFNYFSLAANNDSNQKSIAIDSDNDGLSNSEEALYGTDPHNPDTDGDGYSDGVEVKSGYDPLRPAPGDKIVTAKNATSTSQTGAAAPSLTESFNNNFQSFIASKNGQSISTTDVKGFIDSEFSEKLSATDLSTVPVADKAQLKIKSQKYAGLSIADRQLKLQKDATDYLNQVIYLLISNAPTPIATTEDLDALQTDFLNRLADFSSPENLAYFKDFGNRLAFFSQQLSTLEIPETMVDLHLKFARIISASLFLQNLSTTNSATDPMGKMVEMTKFRDIVTLLSDFFTNDFQSYLKQIGTIKNS